MATILVTGATGHQGGATARHLLSRGFTVRALTRNPEGDAARSLASHGAEVVGGDMENPESLDAAMQGVDGVFSVQNYWVHGAEGEMRQGRNVAEAVKRNGVKHLVYTSVGGAERNTGIPHFDSKREIEKYIESLGVSHTILRPVFFMENLLGMFGPNESNGYTIALAMEPERPLQIVAVDDIGWFGADAFANPGNYPKEGLELAGDELTGGQIAETYSRHLGRPVTFVSLSIDDIRAYGEDSVTMFDWFNKAGYKADIGALRGRYSGLQSFDTWAGSHIGAPAKTEA